ncbi:MAG TPA: DUF4349 domain-containing protein [Sporichthyaceae bacterium]|jgi:hypothetical protein|nr:DUF4349 domain-containing protein [Sporichthyaceae bacterium]
MTRPPKAATAALVLAALAGCSSGPSHNSASTASSAGAMSGMAEGAPAASPAAPAAAASTTGASSAKRSAKAAPQSATGHSSAAGSNLGIPTSALAGRNIAYNAEETLKVDDVGKAVSSVEAAAAGAGGLVADSERSGLGDDATANLVLKVPPGGFNAVLDRIGTLGEVTDRNLIGNDVTDQVVDVAGRVDSQRKSVDRVRALMAQATRLSDVVELEGELSSREADLEALLARQQKLAQQTDLATVTVHVQSKPHPAAVPPAPHTRRAGFVSGLDDGWTAFTGALTVGSAVLGAVLPFGLLMLVLFPVVVLVMRRMRRDDVLDKSATG